ncbi:MAG: hypothetical protein ABEI77_05050 [Halorientalis sp.]
MRSPSRRQVALGLIVLFAVLVLASPQIVGGPRRFDPAACQQHGLVLYRSAEQPADVNLSEPRTGTYESLTATQQAAVRRAAAQPGDAISLNESTYEAVATAYQHHDSAGGDERLPHVLLYNDSVYRAGYPINQCPLAPGVPVAFNPILAVFLRLNHLITGPLAPLLVVGVGLGLAWWVGKRIQY